MTVVAIASAPTRGWRPWLARLAGLAGLLSAGSGAVDVLGGADPRWAAAAWLLLGAPALALLVEVWEVPGRDVPPLGLRVPVLLAALGPVVAIYGAVLGDSAGINASWLGLAALWWLGVGVGTREARPGLALLSVASAVTCLAAVAVVGLAAPEPLASVGGARAVLAIAWSAWAGFSLLR